VSKPPSALHLRWDIASTWALVRFVSPLGGRALRPEVHLFLADRYGMLAEHHRNAGHHRRALVLERKAEEHLRLGGGDEPPPAVAVAMPVPSSSVPVDAIWRPPDGPDDAA
jgi:hypothetical protein